MQLQLIFFVSLSLGCSAWVIDRGDSRTSKPVKIRLLSPQVVKRGAGAVDDYDIAFDWPTHTEQLRFRRNTKLDKDFPVYLVGDDRKPRSVNPRQIDWTALQGLDHESAVLIKRTPSGLNLKGILKRNDEWVSIDHLSSGEHVAHKIDNAELEEISLVDDQEEAKQDGETTVHPPEQSQDVFSTIRIPEQSQNEQSTVIIPEQSQRAKRSDLTQEMNVELMVNFDYSLYQRWTERTSDALGGTFETSDVIDNMKEYYVYFINAMELRFRVIRDHDINIHVVLGTLVISETQEGSYWTEYDRIDGEGTLQRSPAVGIFDDWVNEQNFTADHYQIHTARLSGGLARMTRMCEYRSASIASDKIEMTTLWTSAHELLHGLGVGHDPSGSTECPRGRIMSSTSGGVGGTDVTSCTINKLREVLTAKIDGDFSCLLSTETEPAVITDLSSYDTNLAEKYSFHQQCWLSSGGDIHASWPAARYYGLGSLCKRLFCSNPKNDYSVWYITPFAYTTCGNKKWCENGKCVASDDAREYDVSYCPLGDHHYCSGMVTPKTLGQCYKGGELQKKCCASCLENKLSSSTCEYGNSHYKCKERDCPNGGTNSCCADFCASRKK